MIGVMEKTLWVFALILVGAIVSAFLYIGPPQPKGSRIEASAAKLTERELNQRMSQPAKKAYQEILKAPPPKAPDGSATKVVRPKSTEVYTVNRAAYYRVSSRRAALGEARTASSEVIDNGDGTNSLKISAFGDGSLLSEVGMKDGDVVDTINGKKIDFSSKNQARILYDECIAQLESGKPIVVNIRRRNSPMRIVVAGDWMLKAVKKAGGKPAKK